MSVHSAVWTSSDPAGSGTYARLPSDWEATPNRGAWEVATAPCSEPTLRVWCIADRASFAVYLPLVARDAWCKPGADVLNVPCSQHGNGSQE